MPTSSCRSYKVARQAHLGPVEVGVGIHIHRPHSQSDQDGRQCRQQQQAQEQVGKCNLIEGHCGSD